MIEYEFKGEKFDSLKALWYKHGECKYATFRTRLHRGFTIEEALRLYVRRRRGGRVQPKNYPYKKGDML